ncbi:MAG: hypothetical protein ABS933_12500, partial [Priestia megaterium]
MKLENRYTNLTPNRSATVPTNAMESINTACTRVDFAAITLGSIPFVAADILINGFLSYISKLI